MHLLWHPAFYLGLHLFYLEESIIFDRRVGHLGCLSSKQPVDFEFGVAEVAWNLERWKLKPYRFNPSSFWAPNPFCFLGWPIFISALPKTDLISLQYYWLWLLLNLWRRFECLWEVFASSSPLLEPRHLEQPALVQVFILLDLFTNIQHFKILKSYIWTYSSFLFTNILKYFLRFIPYYIFIKLQKFELFDWLQVYFKSKLNKYKSN